MGSGLAWFLAAVLLALAGRTIGDDELPAGVVVPLGGLAFVWVLRAESRVGTAATAAGVAASYLPPLLVTGVPPSTALSLTAEMVVQSVVSVVLLRRWCPGLLGAGGTTSVHDPLTLARGTAAVVLGTLSGAVLLAGARVLDGSFRPLELVAWWGSHLAGLVLLTAALHEWWELGSVRLIAPGRRLELAVLTLVSCGAALAVFTQDELSLGFAVMAFAIWAGSRFDTLVAAAVMGVVCALSVVLTRLGHGPFGGLAETAAALTIQGFVVAVMLTTFAVSTGREERWRLLDEVSGARRDAESRVELLDAMTEAMSEGLVIVDGDGRIIRTNAAARHLLDLSETGFRQATSDYFLYRRDGSRIAPDELPSRRALIEGTVDPVDVVLRYPNGRERILNTTAHRLTGGFEGAPVAAVVVYRDVTEERERADQIADFAYVVAHDLRNPLSSARGWVEMARAAADEGRDGRALLDQRLVRAARALGRMSHLVEDLLAQAEADSGALQLQEVVLDGEDGLVAEVARELDRVDAVEVEPMDPVLADVSMCHQLLINLLGNAVKYVPDGVVAEVCVRGRRVGPRIEVTVEDNGIGVPPALAPKIFERFYRTPDASRGYAGTGLGLAICRSIVERHGGSIACEARPDGVRGSRFVFDLPAAG